MTHYPADNNHTFCFLQKEALESYRELLAVQQSRGEAHKKGEAEAHKLMGNVYIALQDMNSALQHYEDALSLFGEAGSHQAAEMQKRIHSLSVGI